MVRNFFWEIVVLEQEYLQCLADVFALDCLRKVVALTATVEIVDLLIIIPDSLQMVI
jgi:hypothetical protein